MSDATEPFLGNKKQRLATAGGVLALMTAGIVKLGHVLSNEEVWVSIFRVGFAVFRVGWPFLIFLAVAMAAYGAWALIRRSS
ncbi:hypothetical protein [Smaragdicoccus niigatensis]|uniref:hypothetical protein n=1 Tax=Smaragdicoccus niigatensis TaxID=359359 RepID=UPI0012DF9967|nr:hypothetical protein [Smaragdicoccus niigatensis]